MKTKIHTLVYVEKMAIAFSTLPEINFRAWDFYEESIWIDQSIILFAIRNRDSYYIYFIPFAKLTYGLIIYVVLV